MEKLLKYSVFRYSPSSISGEKINLGILFYDEKSGYKAFRYTKKFARLSSFDDEVNIEFVKKLLQSIQEEVTKEEDKRHSFSIEQFIQYYINDYYFDRVKTIRYDEVDDITERLYNTYFRFDLEPNQRPTRAEDKRLIEAVITTKGASYQRNRYICGKFDDRVKYDIITDDYCIKIFDFDNKDLKRSINNAKTWAWNAKYCEEKTPVIIYRCDSQDAVNSKEFDTIMRIFGESKAKVYDIDSGIQYIQSCV